MLKWFAFNSHSYKYCIRTYVRFQCAAHLRTFFDIHSQVTALKEDHNTNIYPDAVACHCLFAVDVALCVCTRVAKSNCDKFRYRISTAEFIAM